MSGYAKSVSSNLIIPTHMQSAPKEYHPNRNTRRNMKKGAQFSRDMHRMTQEGNSMMTDEVKIMYIFTKEGWSLIEGRQKIGVLKDLGFDDSYTIHAVPMRQIDEKWYSCTPKDCTHIEFTQGWN